jgi:hypothetical protein
MIWDKEEELLLSESESDVSASLERARAYLQKLAAAEPLPPPACNDASTGHEKDGRAADMWLADDDVLRALTSP